MKDIKDYRQREQSLYVIANVMVFLVAHSIIDVKSGELTDTAKILSELFNNERITRLDERMIRLEVSYENKTQQIISLLREDYSRAAGAAAKVEDYDEVKDQVQAHDHALQDHNSRITILEKKAAT
jgi:hypothetical protein